MYKAAVRWMIRRNIASLNAGDHRPALAMFSDDIEFSFPGDNSWADEFRPRASRPRGPRDPSRQGRDGALLAALRRRRAPDGGRGHPRQRAAVEPASSRARPRLRTGRTGDRYNNRAVLFVTSKWGKLRTQEDYEDTQRAAAFDALLDGRAAVSERTAAPT